MLLGMRNCFGVQNLISQYQAIVARNLSSFDRSILAFGGHRTETALSKFRILRDQRKQNDIMSSSRVLSASKRHRIRNPDMKCFGQNKSQKTPAYTKAFEQRYLRIYDLRLRYSRAQRAETAIKPSNPCFERAEKAERHV
jgi:hypothetical protein